MATDSAHQRAYGPSSKRGVRRAGRTKARSSAQASTGATSR